MPTAAKFVVVDVFATVSDGVPIAIDVDAVLLPTLTSLDAPVVPLTVLVPAAVGVPVTVQAMLAPMATVVGGVGVHVDVRPAGSPATEQVALVALSGALDEFVHEYVPE